MKPCYRFVFSLIACLAMMPQTGYGQLEGGPTVVPAAIFGFQDLDAVGKPAFIQPNNNRNGTSDIERRAPAIESSLGQKVSALLFAELAASPNLILVERDEFDKVIDELELSLSGIVDPTKANQIGRITGAKILISGSVMKIDSKLYVIAKIIGTETSRVLGASAKGDVELGIDPLVTKIAEDINQIIMTRSKELLPKTNAEADRIAEIRKKIVGKPLPTISIKIPEQHIGSRAIDPAAESELSHICKELGFDILDGSSTEGKKADLIISGEGMAEFAVRRKNLVSVKARLEIKVYDNTSKRVLVTDRQTIMGVDVTEQIAGKSALQQAALEMAERLIPKMLEERKKISE
jgi:hypothetical protein